MSLGKGRSNSISSQKVLVEQKSGDEEQVAGEDGNVERANEKVLGRPTVVVNALRKTFRGQVAVNDLSFKMYENQIFSLLGHNGAGKVSIALVLPLLFCWYLIIFVDRISDNHD